MLDIRQSWQYFFGSESHFSAEQKECATPPHVHQVIIAHDQFYQAFPRVNTASDKHWGKKAWVRS